MKRSLFGRLLSILVLSLMMLVGQTWASTAHRRVPRKHSSKTTAAARAKARKGRHVRRHRYYGQVWSTNPLADSTEGDDTAGDDPVVRDAAVRALGPLNGSIVVVDPATGRILSMVNQKVALGRGYTPCSTIKMPVTLAALQEGAVDPDERVKLTRRWSMSLTDALAHSNNMFFERLGARLGWDKLSKYERDFGFGELAGYSIPGETLGTYPEEAPATGVAHMSSFGEPINVTPLQLAAFTAAVANGGTLYYLQYPRTEAQKRAFEPRVKRQLDIKQYLPALRAGMVAAVSRGTARRLDNPYDQVAGKTGTCSEGGTRLGWFASFESPENPKLVVVVLLRGGRWTAGPRAAEVAGRVYRMLHEANYQVKKDTLQQAQQQPPPQGPESQTPASKLTPAVALFQSGLK